MNIATVASETIWKDCAKNLEQVERHVAKVLELHPETDIILFPEISLMGFVTDPSNKEIAEDLDGHCVTKVKEIAKRNGVALICGIIERNEKGNPFNTSFVVSKEGEMLAAYRKNHLFTESAEPDVFSSGTELITFKLGDWKCGISTCFDIRFPRLFETYKKAGVECMFSGFNWVQGRNKPAIMKHLVKARAHENQYFFAAVDRTGSDPNTTYYGTGVISSPYCEELSERQEVYAFATIAKEDILSLGKALPLSGSFKPEYTVVEN